MNISFKNNQVKQKHRHLFVFLFFLLLSSLLWTLIKLSDSYSVQSEIKINYTDIPVDKWMPLPHSQTIKVSISTTGFKILNYYTTSRKKRFVNVSLNEIHPHQQRNNTYFVNPQRIIESIATLVQVNANNIAVDDNDFIFTLEDMKSKTVPVILRSDFQLRKQFEIYNEPKLNPKEVLIYGPLAIIDSIDAIYTTPFKKVDVHSNINDKVALDFLEGQLQSKTKEINVAVEVEKYTEISLSIPIEPTKNVRYFPGDITVSYLVAIRDFKQINEKSFHITIDTTDLIQLSPFLKVQVAQPKNIKIVRIEPKQIEYLITQNQL